MLHVDVARSLGVVLLYVVDELVCTLQVEPALVLTAELQSALLQNRLNVNRAADGIVLTGEIM